MKGVIYQYKINGKYYVGKTYMQERKRKEKHKYEAFTLNKEHPFCKAIRKYGWESVLNSYSVIEAIEDDDVQSLNKKLIEREKFWILERNAVVPNGYNIYSKGQVSIPHTYNKSEIYKKISNSLKGKYLNASASSVKVYCVEQQMWYPSISEAERQNGIARGSIGKAASGKNCKAGGMTWSYDGKEHERVDGIKTARKPIYCIEKEKRYNSIYEAAQDIFGADNATNKKCSIQAALKRKGSANGLHFIYLDK